MKFIIITLIALFPLTALSHDANKAYYKINHLESTVEVEAEFPWTIRNSLLKFDPSLRESKNKEDYDQAFFEYVKTNFILTDVDGNQLELKNIEPIVSTGHSHQNDFKFIFKGNTIHTISNTILLNLENEQENIHSLIIEGDSIEFVTSDENNAFKINISSNTTGDYLWLIVILVIPIAIIKKRFTN